MRANSLSLSSFITWDQGENYPFSACMNKLVECLGDVTGLYTYNFFAGLSGDDFVMCYGNNGLCNDCVSVCQEPLPFLERTLKMAGLDFTYIPTETWKQNIPALKKEVRARIDRGIPVLAKSESTDRNFYLLFRYENDGDSITLTCGAPDTGTISGLQETSYALSCAPCSFIFIDSPPKASDIAGLYRKSVLQIPKLMTAPAYSGVSFGARAYRDWAKDLRSGRYEDCTADNFDRWSDWCIYVCNIATNAGHGRDFLSRAYAHNPDMPNIPRLIALLEQNTCAWNQLEALGFGFNIRPEAFRDSNKCAAAAETIERLAAVNDEICGLF